MIYPTDMFFDMITYAYYLIPCIHLYTRPTLVSNNKSLQLDHWNFLILYLIYAICVCGRGKHSWFAAFTVCTNCRYLEIGIAIAAKIISIRTPLTSTQRDFWWGSVSFPDHLKLSVRFQPWNCWGPCSNIDVDPPLFTLLQQEMPTDGVITGWCDRPLMPRSHQTFSSDFSYEIVGDYVYN